MPSLAPDFLLPDYDAPLVAIRHTVLRPANESILAICISHIMVDGDSLSRLAHHLSFLYDSPGSVLDQPPTFLARIQWGSWPPSKEVIEANRLDLSRLCDTPSAQLAVGARMIGSTEAITIPLSGAEVVYLKQRHGVEGGSSTDAICGWLTDLLERVGEVTKPQLSTVVNYRTWHHASGLIPRDLINQYNTAAIIVSVPSDHSPAPSRAKHVAQMIRSSINRYKTDPGSILAELTMRLYVLQTAAESGKILAFGVAPGQLTFNSTIRYDWQPIFGFGKRSAVHTVWTSPRYLRIWRSNPVVGEEDAAWDASVEISFAVGSGVKAFIDQLLEAERESWRAEFHHGSL